MSSAEQMEEHAISSNKLTSFPHSPTPSSTFSVERRDEGPRGRVARGEERERRAAPARRWEEARPEAPRELGCGRRTEHGARCAESEQRVERDLAQRRCAAEARGAGGEDRRAGGREAARAERLLRRAGGNRARERIRERRRDARALEVIERDRAFEYRWAPLLLALEARAERAAPERRDARVAPRALRLLFVPEKFNRPEVLLVL
jgi:hypothetical protein